MKLAASTLGCPQWTLHELCTRLRSYDYQGVELRGLGPDLDLTRSPVFVPSALGQTKRMMADSGLEVCSVDTSASFADPARHASSVSETQAAVALAQSLGASFVRVFGGSIPDGISRPETVAAMSEILYFLGDYAEQTSDVTIVLETHDSFSTGRQVAEVLAQVSHPRIAALWDLHHPYRHGETPEQTYAALAPYVRHVHVKDSRPPADYCLLGKGNVPVFEMLRLLQNGGYDGWLSLEWEKRWHSELLDPTVAFPQYADKLREYLAQLSS